MNYKSKHSINLGKDKFTWGVGKRVRENQKLTIFIQICKFFEPN